MLKRITAVLTVTIMLLCGCNNGDNNPASVNESIIKGKPQHGGQITLYSLQHDTFNPLLTSIKANYDVLGLIFEPVVRNKADGTPEGVLVTSWSKSRDGRVYNLNVRPDIVFHDGSPLDAQDIVASINTATTADSPFHSSLSMVESVVAAGNTVKIVLVNPVPNFISLLEIPVVQSGYASAVNDYLPVGTGPFRYDGAQSKSYTLSVNEKWWQEKPYINKINVKILPDKETVTPAYDSRNIDAFATDAITAGKYYGDGQSRVTYYDEDTLVFLGFNNQSVAFTEVEARIAVAMGIDKEKINEEANLSNYTVTESPVHPSKKYYNSDITVYKPASEEEMPTRVAPFEIIVCETSLANKRIGETISKQLTEKGFNVVLTPLSESNYIDRINLRQYDAFVGSFAQMGNCDMYGLLGDGNAFNYTSDLMNEYFTSLYSGSGEDSVASIYAKIQKLYSTDLPFISLFYEKKALVMRNTIAGDVLSQQGFVYNNLPNWYTEVK